MAAIDKTYVNKEQLLEAISWSKEIGEVTLENGYKFRPLDFISVHDNMENLIDTNEYVLWNTPMWFDRWLWLNCPLPFVQTRLQEQYDSYTLEVFESWTYEEPVNRKKNMNTEEKQYTCVCGRTFKSK